MWCLRLPGVVRLTLKMETKNKELKTSKEANAEGRYSPLRELEEAIKWAKKVHGDMVEIREIMFFTPDTDGKIRGHCTLYELEKALAQAREEGISWENICLPGRRSAMVALLHLLGLSWEKANEASFFDSHQDAIKFLKKLKDKQEGVEEAEQEIALLKGENADLHTEIDRLNEELKKDSQ